MLISKGMVDILTKLREEEVNKDPYSNYLGRLPESVRTKLGQYPYLRDFQITQHPATRTVQSHIVEQGLIQSGGGWYRVVEIAGTFQVDRFETHLQAVESPIKRPAFLSLQLS